MAQSVIDIAIAHLDAQIADLERAKSVLQLAALSTEGKADAPKVRKPRGPNKHKRGLPVEDSGGL